MKVQDNSSKTLELNQLHLSFTTDIQKFANKSIKDLCEVNRDLLVFPNVLGYHKDDIGSSAICCFDSINNTLKTNNILGFVGCNDTQLSIVSRFDDDELSKNYFMHYMLQCIFSINLFHFDTNSNKESIWDFLIYLFPYFLKRAFSQGIYKVYIRNEYNNANVKGAINITRHIRQNIPFQGSVAYTTREHSYDNSVTQLIRHTIEHIRSKKLGNGVLNSDTETRALVQKINYITQNSYKKSQRRAIILKNLQPISHPYFTEYKILQKLCLKILRHEKITYGENKDKVYGLLFDGAWLWEKYLNTILKDDFIHPENKTGRHKQYLFESRIQPIYPDFISKEKPTIVADAKYIPLDRSKTSSYHSESEKALSIYYKTITYMYRFNSLNGLLLFPMKNKNVFKEDLKIKEAVGKISKIGFPIPTECENYNDFSKRMKESETFFSRILKSLKLQS